MRLVLRQKQQIQNTDFNYEFKKNLGLSEKLFYIEWFIYVKYTHLTHNCNILDRCLQKT